MPDLIPDPQLLAAFLDETQESLASLAALFVALEAAPQAHETIEAIFRPIHSLKGNAAFFGFMATKHLAHEMETLLDQLRKGRLAASRPVIDALLAGVDALQAVIGRLRAGGPEVEDPTAYEALIQRVVEATGLPTTTATISRKEVDWDRCLADLELLAGLVAGEEGGRRAVARLREVVQGQRGTGDTVHPSRSAATRMVADPQGAGRLIAAIDALMKAPLPLADPAAHEVLAHLERLQQEVSDPAAAPVLAEMIETWKTLVPAIGFDVVVKDFIAAGLGKVGACLVDRVGEPTAATSGGEALELRPGSALSTDSTRATTDTARHRTDSGRVVRTDQIAKTMRVSEGAIDQFLSHVGELLVLGDLFNHLLRRVSAVPGAGELPRDFRRATDSFADLSNRLQRAIMTIRRVPIRPLLQKVPRLIRDVAAQRGKEVAVMVVGETVEVDKSLVELLDAPLTHLARNAADHGIEPPDERQRLGKPLQGTVTITAAENATALVLTIEDDGRGLDLARIRAKAESMGLVAPGTNLTEPDIINFIFASGVSTAVEVTEVSGRGVGMDVVKRAIDEAGGTIQIQTTPGQGARFTITLPKRVTTQIIPGYLVRAAGQPFVIPLDRVQETFKAVPADCGTMPGRGRFLTRHGKVLPLADLGVLLGKEEPDWPERGRPVVAVESRHRRLALAVEAVLGVQKVVIRPLTGLGSGAELFAGGALMGDGAVALILEIEQLLTCVGTGEA